MLAAAMLGHGSPHTAITMLITPIPAMAAASVLGFLLTASSPAGAVLIATLDCRTMADEGVRGQARVRRGEREI